MRGRWEKGRRGLFKEVGEGKKEERGRRGEKERGNEGKVWIGG